MKPFKKYSQPQTIANATQNVPPVTPSVESVKPSAKSSAVIPAVNVEMRRMAAGAIADANANNLAAVREYVDKMTVAGCKDTGAVNAVLGSEPVDMDSLRAALQALSAKLAT